MSCFSREVAPRRKTEGINWLKGSLVFFVDILVGGEAVCEGDVVEGCVSMCCGGGDVAGGFVGEGDTADVFSLKSAKKTSGIIISIFLSPNAQ